MPADLILITSRMWRIAPSQSRKGGPYGSQKRPRPLGRHCPGMVGEIISEWWARPSGTRRATFSPARSP
jgi:hypothetical protein